jgi:hypothetical protein
VEPEEDPTAALITTVDGLAPMAYCVTGARALRSACNLGVALHMIGGLLGMGVVLALVLLSFVGREHDVWMYRLPAAAAMAVGLLEVLVSFGAPEALLNWLPLSGLGFAWVIPVAVAAGIGALLQKGK